MFMVYVPRRKGLKGVHANKSWSVLEVPVVINGARSVFSDERIQQFVLFGCTGVVVEGRRNKRTPEQELKQLGRRPML